MNDKKVFVEEDYSSLCHVQTSDLFPLCSVCTEEGELKIPFTPLHGEAVEFLGRSADGVLALSNYRFYFKTQEACYNIPIGIIENVEVKDLVYLHVVCKHAHSVRCLFSRNEECLLWHQRMVKLIVPPKNIESFFAFPFFAWASESGDEELGRRLSVGTSLQTNEVDRLNFNLHGAWRLSHVNSDYKLCPSYPKYILVPACTTDVSLESVAKFRISRRVPAVVWRHVNNGAVIARCSQPEVGLFGWRSAEDEDLIKAIADACSFDNGANTSLNFGNPSDEFGSFDTALESNIPASGTHSKKKVLIVDARSYATAVANRARGGGCEYPEYYPNCEIKFMNLANIHSVRKSFQTLRNLCAHTCADIPNWYTLLDGTHWLHHISGLIQASVSVVSAIEEGRPVIVHCSDGWDRTSQIVALAELMLDPYYRTVNGFQVLIEREWLEFGHKFSDRCGHNLGYDDANERCPVFLQWLDCVHQLLIQFPCYFEFSVKFLVKLAEHTYSRLFGTFLCNSAQEREKERVFERTFSVWKYLQSPLFINHFYVMHKEVLWPSCNLRDLVLWREMYLDTVKSHFRPSVEKNTHEIKSVESGSITPDESVQKKTINKIHSWDNLTSVSESTNSCRRRSSDSRISKEVNQAGFYIPGNIDAYAGQTLNNGAVFHSKEYKKILKLLPEAVKEKSIVNTNKKHAKLMTSDYSTVTAVSSCEVEQDLNLPLSAESSTDTLVETELNKQFDSVLQITKEKNDTEVNSSDSPSYSTLTTTSFTNGDNCKVCADNRRLLADIEIGSGANSSTTSYFSTPTVLSQTPNSVYVSSPSDEKGTFHSVSLSSGTLFDIDGMVVLLSDVQGRIQQILTERKIVEEALQRELYTTRLALIQQVCHHCGNMNAEAEGVEDVNSLPGSACSAEQQSLGESLPSDVSWEAVEERDAGMTLWVPDHAVNRCMGCDTEFWLGRRKHHCRKCGRIFCADCSEKAMPVPNEQLYDPVRVCADCYSVLHNTSIPPQEKSVV